MPVSERLRSCWGPSRLAHLAIFGHRNEESLRYYIGRPSSEKIKACSDILSDALSGRPHQSLQPSVTALSSRAIFIFRWIRLSFIYKILALDCLFSTCHVKKLACFYEPQFGRVSLSISLSDSVLETKRLQAEVLNSTCRTVQVFKLLQNVNFDGFWTLMIWHFWQLLSCTTNQIIWTILTGILIGSF